MNTTIFSNIKILRPSDEILNCFNVYVRNIFNRILLNQIENNSLSDVRDLLLPKLLNKDSYNG